MRRKGSYNYLIEERNRELQLAFDRIIRELGVLASIEDVYREMEKLPSRRFWISGDCAFDKIFRRSKPKGRRREMYDDILRIAKRHAEIKQVSMRDAIDWAVTRPAPSFYMSRETMHNVLLKRGKRR